MVVIDDADGDDNCTFIIPGKSEEPERVFKSNAMSLYYNMKMKSHRHHKTIMGIGNRAATDANSGTCGSSPALLLPPTLAAVPEGARQLRPHHRLQELTSSAPTTAPVRAHQLRPHLWCQQRYLWVHT